MNNQNKKYSFDGFISYSRKDTAFAAALERALKAYRPPKDLKVPQRRLNVFRDAEDLTGTEYYSSIERSLSVSNKLIVICSPNARGSRFVNDEISRYLQHHEAKDIIPIIIAGLPNNEAVPGSEEELAFPDALLECLELPLANDYRGFNPKSDTISKGRFSQAWYKLLADIYECSRAEVEQREQRRRFRQRVQITSFGLVLTIFLGGVGFYGYQRNNVAKSNNLAASALQLVENDPEGALLSAYKSVETFNTPLSESALRVAMAKSPNMTLKLSTPTPVSDDDFRSPTSIAFSPVGAAIAIADETPRIVDLSTGVVKLSLEKPDKYVRLLQFSPDGLYLAATNEINDSAIIDARTGKIVSHTQGELHWRSATNGSKKAVLLRDTEVQVGEFDQQMNFVVSRSITPPDYNGPKDFSEDPTHELDGVTNRIAMLVEDGSGARLTVTDLENGKSIVKNLVKPNGLWKLLWSPKGNYIALASLTGLNILDSLNLKTVLLNDTDNEITIEDIGFSADEKLLASTDRNGMTSLWSISNGKRIAEFSGPDQRAYHPVLSSNGGLLSAHFADNSVAIFRVDQGLKAFEKGINLEPTARIPSFWKGSKSANFSPQADWLVVEHEDSRLSLWQTERWLPERRIPLRYDWEIGNPVGLKSLIFNSNVTSIGVRKGDKVTTWNVTSGAPIEIPSAQMKSLEDITLKIYKGLRLVTDKQDDTVVHVVDDKSGAEKYGLKHSAEVMSKSFSPNGNCILTTSPFFMASGMPPEHSDVARLWDTGTGKLLSEWPFGYGEPQGAIFSGVDRVVVLSEGDAQVFHTQLCADVGTLKKIYADNFN